MYTYQSLKNSFLITESPVDARSTCNRLQTDGVLEITSITSNHVYTSIFNADGSNGHVCVNGARCIARYMYDRHQKTHIFVHMGDIHIEHVVQKTAITQILPLAKPLGELCITTPGGAFRGFYVDAGNPHFIMRQKRSLFWLKTHGSAIEMHDAFKDRTNVECVWKEGDHYRMLVHERGCGITQACSSGATALISLLYAQKEVDLGQEIAISMLGGVLRGTVIQKDQHGVAQAVQLRANASSFTSGLNNTAEAPLIEQS